MKSREILIWLNTLRGASSRYLERLDLNFSDLSELLRMESGKILNLEGVGNTLKKSIVSERDGMNVSGILRDASVVGADIVTIRDDGYPENLRNIPDAPRVLYIKGKMKKEDRLSISVVGPRKASSYGISVAESISKELARLGITVVSGLALGVDAAAHMASLKEGGRTVAVLGTGVDIVYPAKNRHIYEEIRENGAIISEFPLGTEGLPYRFPQRNRIVSGISLGTVVVEARENSGTLTTVSHGLEQGREIFAVPGSINSVYSRGTNSLIQDGAKLVQSVDDILCEISELKRCIETENTSRQKVEKAGLSKSEIEIIEFLEVEPMSAEKISDMLKEPMHRVLGMLTVLELKKKVRKERGNRFSAL